jgi:prepilin-type processing-associated H-X9-DG protein
MATCSASGRGRASISLNGGTLGDFPEAVQECFRHMGWSNTCWLDGHVSGIKETTGEDVPRYWYTGVRED